MKIDSKTPKTLRKWKSICNEEGIAQCGNIIAHVYSDFCDLQYQNAIFMTLYKDGRIIQHQDIATQYINFISRQ